MRTRCHEVPQYRTPSLRLLGSEPASECLWHWQPPSHASHAADDPLSFIYPNLTNHHNLRFATSQMTGAMPLSSDIEDPPGLVLSLSP